jgi:hypothetical protein
MPYFKQYITNMITLTEIENEGEAEIAFRFRSEGFGIGGDGEGSIEFPWPQTEGELTFIPWGESEFPIFEIISQNAIEGTVEFTFETEGDGQVPKLGNCQFPLLQIESWGREGNSGECSFLFETSGEGDANREYELCE